MWGEQVLLCRRAIEPRRGFRTLPAGFMENGETLEQAAARETLEEACARVHGMQLYTLFDLPHINQVYMLFRAELADLDFAAGEEPECACSTSSRSPGQAQTRPSAVLECYFADRATQHFPVRNEPLAALRAHHKKA